MFIYISIIAVFYLLGISKIKNRKAVFWCMMCSLMLISAIRYDVGYDWDNFLNVLQSFSAGHSTYTEAGYNAYMWVIDRFFGSNVIVLYAGESIFTLYAFGYFIEKNVKKKYWIYVAALFVTTTIFFSTMNTSRQYVAVGILLFSFEQLKKKHYLWCFALCILACTFHASAVVVPLFYLILIGYRNAGGKKNLIMKIVNVTVIVSIFLGMIDIHNLLLVLKLILNRISFLSRFSWYFGTSYFLSRNNMAFIKYIIPDLFWFYVYFVLLDKLRKISSWADYYVMMFAVCLIIGNCFSGINVFVRISWYFEVFLLPLVPLAVEAHENMKKRLEVKLFFMAYYLALSVYVVFLADTISVVPYQTFIGKLPL